MVLPLEMGWRRRLFESWPIDPEQMDAHRQETLSPDTRDDAAWLSVGPSRTVDVRPKGLSRWGGVQLPELDGLTYVTRDGEPVHAYSPGLDVVAEPSERAPTGEAA